MELIVIAMAGALLVVVGIAAYAILLYNSLVRLRHGVDQAWANVDVLLKQRRDEIGSLLAGVRADGDRERELLARLAALREQVGDGRGEAERLDAERQIGPLLAQVMAAAAREPALREDQGYRRLEEKIGALEERIGHRREFYNEMVAINNARLEQLPDRLLAAKAGLRPRPLFVARGEDRADPRVVRDGPDGAPRLHLELPAQGLPRPTSGMTKDE